MHVIVLLLMTFLANAQAADIEEKTLQYYEKAPYSYVDEIPNRLGSFGRACACTSATGAVLGVIPISLICTNIAAGDCVAALIVGVPALYISGIAFTGLLGTVAAKAAEIASDNEQIQKNHELKEAIGMAFNNDKICKSSDNEHEFLLINQSILVRMIKDYHNNYANREISASELAARIKAVTLAGYLAPKDIFNFQDLEFLGKWVDINLEDLMEKLFFKEKEKEEKFFEQVKKDQEELQKYLKDAQRAQEVIYI
jgi:hypothetical protein